MSEKPHIASGIGSIKALDATGPRLVTTRPVAWLWVKWVHCLLYFTVACRWKAGVGWYFTAQRRTYEWGTLHIKGGEM
mgnify:CR=1